MSGRWVGRWYEWSCEDCHCVVQSDAPPPRDECRCLRCDADHWRGRALRAERTCAEQQDQIFELQQQAKRSA